MINMLSGESLIKGANVNNSMDLWPTRSLLKISTPNIESSLSSNFRSLNGITTSIWITVHRDDDKLYKFKEGDLKRLRIQDIKDMLLLLVQGKLTNLTVEERFAFNTIWKRSDKERAASMIQAIDKQLKTRRIMRSLEKFIGGRLYEGDFKMLQRTI
uniref:Uncharacterized protein n=1 Tax=Tanacetum cinerariifolium TaxID=118510 RepID=A0A6L2JP17_TANCI|nr:hypothetical protein [Tanacetum cinerariifolium]GEU38717.1 hypothetical protein [Tanacetum cinerariifolium]